MAWLFIIIGTFFLLCGLIMSLRGLHRRLHWPEVPGEIVDFKEHESNTDDGVQISYIPQVKYVVKNKEYVAFANENITWQKRDFSKKVTVLYDRYDPEVMYLKDNTFVLGCAIVIFAAVFVILGISFL